MGSADFITMSSRIFLLYEKGVLDSKNKKYGHGGEMECFTKEGIFYSFGQHLQDIY